MNFLLYGPWMGEGNDLVPRKEGREREREREREEKEKKRKKERISAFFSLPPGQS